MRVDCLSEPVSAYIPAISIETDRWEIQSSSDRGSDTRRPQHSHRLGNSIVAEVPTAKAQVEDAACLGISEAMLAKFEQTVTQDRPRLLWQAQRVVRRREIAEEIVQESLLKAYRALPCFRGESGMRTWLYAIVRNATIEYLRNQREHLQVSLEHFFEGDGDSIYDPPDSRNGPEDHYRATEMWTILMNEVDGLGPFCKDAYQMCILEGNTQLEAAVAFNISVGKVKSRVCRAKRMLSTRVRRRVGLASQAEVKMA